jgi:hypothetical protein
MRRTAPFTPRLAALAASAVTLAAAALAPAASAAAPKPVPCDRDGGTNHYECSWYPAGDGHSGGAPVQAASGAKVGYLHQGRNWIVCQQRGSRVTSGKNTNVWWGWTTADNQKTGWVSALYAQGGDNDQGFAGVPNCNGAHGSAPVVTPTPAPAPTPTPAPTPQPTGPSRATLAAAVKAVAFEPVYGPNYGRYKRRFPQGEKPNTIIWEKDGCSIPKAAYAALGPVAGRLLKVYDDDFRKSCDRHDFGYRNYGSVDGGLALDPTEKRRKAIDDRFHKNMDLQCDRIFDRKIVEYVQRKACHKASDVFYEAVRGYGEDDFR